MPSPSPATATTTARPTHACRFHCAACGRHFLSLRAFDLHRSGAWDARVCLEPADLPERFRILTAEGICKLTGAEHSHHQTIWGLEGIDNSRLAALKGRREDGAAPAQDGDGPDEVNAATTRADRTRRSR